LLISSLGNIFHDLYNIFHYYRGSRNAGSSRRRLTEAKKGNACKTEFDAFTHMWFMSGSPVRT
jgi:hypothetical protein